jgi:hypothetical protein
MMSKMFVGEKYPLHGHGVEIHDSMKRPPSESAEGLSAK